MRMMSIVLTKRMTLLINADADEKASWAISLIWATDQIVQ